MTQDITASFANDANVVADIIEKKKLYNIIHGGKKYVKCEGWTLLAALKGYIPRELNVDLRSDGSFVATVELVRLTDGMIVSRASAECGLDERTWVNSSLYARRSMAITRATSKVCRVAFSWMMALAGYEVTPAEEMDNVAPIPNKKINKIIEEEEEVDNVAPIPNKIIEEVASIPNKKIEVLSTQPLLDELLAAIHLKNNLTTDIVKEYVNKRYGNGSINIKIRDLPEETLKAIIQDVKDDKIVTKFFTPIRSSTNVYSEEVVEEQLRMIGKK